MTWASADRSPALRTALKLFTYWQWPGWILFAAGLAFSISFTNYSIFGLVLLPLILRADLTRRSPLYATPLDWPFAALYASMVIASLGAYAVGGQSFGQRSFLWTVSYTAPVVYFTVCYALPEQPGWIWKAMAWALLTAAAANSLYAVIQFGVAVRQGQDLFSVRPGGRMFYMTYGGVMMLVITFAVSLFIKGNLRVRARVILGALVTVMVAGLAASLVRSAWVGLAASVFAIAVLADRRLLWAFPVVIALGVLVAPRPILKRAESILNAATAEAKSETEGPPEFRVDIWRTSLRIAARYPLTGVGLHNSIDLYDRFKDATSWESRVPHAHNNYIQLLVERGVVGLAAFGYFVVTLVKLFLSSYRSARSPTTRVISLAGFGATVGFLIEGFFEYTFGDYEIMVIIYTLAAAAVASRRREELIGREEAAAR